MEVNGQTQVLAVLPLVKKPPWYPQSRRLSGFQRQCEHFGEKKKLFLLL
jgi:hypothetical protein